MDAMDESQEKMDEIEEIDEYEMIKYQMNEMDEMKWNEGGGFNVAWAKFKTLSYYSQMYSFKNG